MKHLESEVDAAAPYYGRQVVTKWWGLEIDKQQKSCITDLAVRALPSCLVE